MGASPTLSHLFTARIMGLWLRRSMCATSSSAAVRPLRTSVTMMMQSAVSMAICACSRMWARMPSVALGSMPPVSTSKNSWPFHSQLAKMRSRVMPGVSSTMARRWPHSLLNRVDLPTLGRPTTATIGLLMGSPPFLKGVKYNKNGVISCRSFFCGQCAGRCAAGRGLRPRLPWAAPPPLRPAAVPAALP